MADNQSYNVEVPILLKWTLSEIQCTNNDKTEIEFLKSNDNENKLNNLEKEIKMSKTKIQKETDSLECDSLGLTVTQKNESEIISEIKEKLNSEEIARDFFEPVEEINSSKIHNGNCYGSLRKVNETFKDSSDVSTFCETQKLETSGEFGSQSLIQPIDKCLEELRNTARNSEFLETKKLKGMFDCLKVTINSKVVNSCQNLIGDCSTLLEPDNEMETKDDAKKIDVAQINELKREELCEEDQIKEGTLNIIENNCLVNTEQLNNPSLAVEEEHGKPFEVNRVESQSYGNTRNVDNIENIMSEPIKQLLKRRGKKRKYNKLGSEKEFKKEMRNVGTMDAWSERLRPRQKHAAYESSPEEVIVKRKRRGMRKHAILNKQFNKYEPLQFGQNYETVQFNTHYEPLQSNKPDSSADDVSLQSSFRTRQFLFEIRSLLIKMEVTVEDWMDGMVTYGDVQISELLNNVKNIHSSLEKEFKNISANLNHILHVDILGEFTELLKKSDKLHCDLRKLKKSIYCRQNTQNISQSQFSTQPEHIPVALESVRVNQLRNLNTRNPRRTLEHGEIHVPLNLSVRNETNQATKLSTNSVNFGILSERNFNCNNLRKNSNSTLLNLSAPHVAQGRTSGVQLFPLHGNNPIQSKILNQNYSGIFQNSLAYNVDNVSMKKGNQFSNYSNTSIQDFSSKEGRVKKARPKKTPKKRKSILSSENGDISAEKKPRAKRKTTKSKEKGRNNEKDLRKSIKEGTDVEISENIGQNPLTENVKLVAMVGDGNSLVTVDGQNIETLKPNCEQNLTDFDIDREIILDEDEMNKILQETNFVKNEIDAEFESELNMNIVLDVNTLNEKSTTEEKCELTTLYTDNNKSKILKDKSENCQNNRNSEYSVSPSIIYCSDDENEELPLQEIGLNNKFLLPLTNLSGERNNIKKRNNCISSVSNLLKNSNDNVSSVNVIQDSEESNTKKTDPPNRNISESNRISSDAIHDAISAGFKDTVASSSGNDKCVNNIVLERPMDSNISSISKELRCMVSSPSSSNSRNLQNMYAQKSMSSSLMNGASSSLTASNSSNKTTNRNPAASSSLNNTTNRNPAASSSLNNTTNRNPAAFNSLNNTTNRNPAASSSLNNTTNRNPAASNSLNNTTNRNPAAASSLNNTTNRNPAASSSLNNTTNRNPAASSSLNNTTNRNPAASNSLNNTTNRNSAASNSLNDIFSKNLSTSRSLEKDNSIIDNLPRKLNETPLPMKLTSSSPLKGNEYSDPTSSLPDAPNGWNPSSLNNLSSAENKGVKDPTNFLTDTNLRNPRSIIRYAPADSKGSNHSTSSEFKNVKNFDSSEPSSLKNIFKNPNAISNQAPNSRIYVPPSMYCAPNNIPFECNAQTTRAEDGVSSNSASALNGNLKDTIVICNSKEVATSTIMSLVDNKPSLVSDNQNKSLSDSSKIIYNDDTLLRSSTQSESVSYSFKRKGEKNISSCKTVKNRIKNNSKSVTSSNDVNMMKNDELQKNMSNKTGINTKEERPRKCNKNSKKFTAKRVIDNSGNIESNTEHIEKYNILENNTTDESLKLSSTDDSLQLQENNTENKISNPEKTIKQNEPIMNTEQFLNTCNTEFINTTEQNVQNVNFLIQNIRTRRVKNKGEYLPIEDFSDLYAQNIFTW